MSTRNLFADDDDDDHPKEPIPVPDLPWYESLRAMLEPYRPTDDPKDADKFFSSAEIISSLEQHHGVPQGLVGPDIKQFVFADDFVRAMHYLGFREVNAGGVQLQWFMKKK